MSDDLSFSRSRGIWEDLIVSILSVNNYPLSKTLVLVDSLRGQGLLDPENLGAWPLIETTKRLKLAGLDRGEFITRLLALRLNSLGAVVISRGLAECEEILQSGNFSATDAFLRSISGIGPRVADNFLSFRGVQQ